MIKMQGIFCKKCGFYYFVFVRDAPQARLYGFRRSVLVATAKALSKRSNKNLNITEVIRFIGRYRRFRQFRHGFFRKNLRCHFHR